LIADLLANVAAKFESDASCGGPRRDTSRLDQNDFLSWGGFRRAKL
jgi:hypothetical protein